MRLPSLCGPRADGRYYLTDPRTRLPVYLGGDRREAERLHREWCAAYLSQETRTPGLAPRSRVSVAELCESFMAWARTNYIKRGRQTSQVANCRLALECVGAVLGLADLPADRLTPLRLKEARDVMVRRGWCRTYVNDEVNVIRRVWSWGVEHELVDVATLQSLRTVSPLRKGKTPAPEAPPVLPAEWWAVEAALPFLTPRWRPLVLAHWHSGMRSEEVVSMRSADIDTSGRTWIYTVSPDWNKVEHHGKGKRVPLGPRCREVLAPVLALARKREGGWVWPTVNNSGHKRKQPGKCLVPCTYRRAVLDAQDRANRARAERELPPLPRWVPLMIRHAALTRIRDALGIEAAQAVAGHEQLSTTEVYAERSWRLACETAEELG